MKSRPAKLEYMKKYAKKKKKQISKYQKEYRAKNKDKSRDYHREYQRKKMQEDPEYKLKRQLRCRINHAVRSQNTTKTTKSFDLIGCTAVELKSYIEARFLPGMSWENRHKWHIDHIKPCASFDLLDPDQQRACFHYTNLQPLWAKDNLKKGDSL